MRRAIKIDLTEADRRSLTAIVTNRNSPQKHVWRAHIVLLTADGCGTMELTRCTGTSKTSVRRWQDRFLAEGLAHRHQRQLGAADLAQARPATAQGQRVQAIQRSAVCRKAGRYRWALCQSA